MVELKWRPQVAPYGRGARVAEREGRIRRRELSAALKENGAMNTV